MALTLTLDYSCSLGGGAKLQCWSVTGDGTTQSFQTRMLRGISGWLQNEDDSTVTAMSMSITAMGGVSLGRPPTSAKTWNVFVIGE